MREYSFKEEGNLGQSSYRDSETFTNKYSKMKSSNSSLRVEEIRRKYDGSSNMKGRVENLKISLLQDKELVDAKNKVSERQNQKYSQDSMRSSLTGHRWRPDQVSGKQNYKNDEQTVFERIKQMKQSLQEKKGFSNPSKQLPDFQIENIDKINMKIKQILECLHEGQSKGRKENEVKFYGREKQLQTNGTPSNYKKSYYKQSTRGDVESNKFSTIEIKESSSILRDESKKYSFEQNKQINSFNLSSENKNTRSKSVLNSLKSGYEVKSGKKLDDQINKIQRKIKEFEDQKKKLNISYTPYRYSSSRSISDFSNKSIHKTNEREKLREAFDKSRVFQKYQNESVHHRKNIESEDFNIDIQQTSGTFGRKVEESQMNSQFKIKLIPVENERDEQFKAMIQLKKKTDFGIEERRKKLLFNTKGVKQNSSTKTSFVKALCEQAKIDEEFRNNKIWFQSIISKQKWNELSNQLSKKSLNLSHNEIQKIFVVSESQNNPFFSIRENSACYDVLVDSYLNSQSYWENKVAKKFDRQSIEAENFCLESIDLEKKGYIVIEDLVRFLNMETGTFFRNRDLVLIYRRITPQERMKFEQFLSAICD